MNRLHVTCIMLTDPISHDFTITSATFDLHAGYASKCRARLACFSSSIEPLHLDINAPTIPPILTDFSYPFALNNQE